MKKYLVLSIAFFASTIHIKAQDIMPVAEDALRMSWNKPSGTARNQAIGGTNVALGGDLSSLFINPAGLGVYSTGEATLSLMNTFSNGNGKYFGNSTVFNNNTIMNIGASGVVFNLSKNTTDNRVGCWRFALGINTIANLNNTVHYKGDNYNTSFSDNPTSIFDNYVVQNQNKGNNNAAKILYSAMDDPELYYVTRLGLQSHLISINKDPANNNLYGFSRAADVLDLDKSFLTQENKITTTGSITELGTALAFEIDNVSMGVSVGVPIVSYQRHKEYTETDGSGLTDNYFNSFKYDEYYTTYGCGINVKAGAIIKLNKLLRLGLAAHTPTFYTKLTNNVNASIAADVENYDPAQRIFKTTTNDLYDKDPAIAYQLNTPAKLMAGLTLLFNETPNVKKQRGFISADVEYINNKWTSVRKIRIDGDDYDNNINSSVNQDIKFLYGQGFNYRAGAELKFSPVMIRGGFSYFTNPYNRNNDLKASMMAISGGLGYRNKGIFLDAAYVYSINKNVDFPYYTNARNYYAETTNYVSNIIVTFGFRF